MIDALDVAITQLVARMCPATGGPPASAIGTELAQLRPYEIGDNVRHIDPAATARTGQTHVRLHVPERALTTWIVLDLSPSMAFGTAQRLKSDVAEGVALVFGRLGVRRAGSVGMVTFGDHDADRLPPRGAKAGIVALRRALEQGVASDGHQDPEGRPMRCDASRAGDAAGARRGDLRLSRRARLGASARVAAHSPLGLAIEVLDPREAELPAVGYLALVDPETGARIEVDTSRNALRGGSPSSRRADASRSRASCAACGSTTASSRPTRTGCSDWGGACDELCRTRLAGRRGPAPDRRGGGGLGRAALEAYTVRYTATSTLLLALDVRSSWRR